MLERILIVCIGNICRSPCAQALMSEAVFPHKRNMKIDSAGLAAQVGLPMEPTTRALLLEHRHRPPPHRACQLELGMLQQADLVLAMEKRHIDSIYRIAPEARGKTFLLGKWQDDLEIRDPFRQDRMAFEQAYRQISTAVEAWAVHLGQ